MWRTNTQAGRTRAGASADRGLSVPSGPKFDGHAAHSFWRQPGGSLDDHQGSRLQEAAIEENMASPKGAAHSKIGDVVLA